jgi:hypothetical protein
MGLRRWLAIGTVLAPLVASVGCAASPSCADTTAPPYIDVSVAAWAKAHPAYGYMRLCSGSHCPRRSDGETLDHVALAHRDTSGRITIRLYNAGGHLIFTRTGVVMTVPRTLHDVCLGTEHDHAATLSLDAAGHLHASLGTVTQS